MRRLSINGIFADLSNDAVGLTWQYFDFTDPARRFNPYSSSIRLPVTPRNASILGYANATGARLTKARSLPDVNYYFGPMKVISGGTLKVDSIDAGAFVCSLNSKTTLQDDLTVRVMDDVIAACTHTWSDTYANVLTSLAAGTDGWLLPRTIEDAISSKTWNIHNYSAPNDVPKHELWISAAALFDAIETLHSFTFSVMEAGAATDLQASDFYADVLSKLYIPAFNWVLYFSTYPTSWRTMQLTSGTRTIGSDSFEYSDVSFFAGKTAWDFVRLMGQLTGCIVYFEDGNIVLAPIDELDAFTAVNLSGKVRRTAKYINLPGYEAKNYLKYKTSDNLSAEYGRSLITADVLPAKEKDIMSIDAVLPGRYYNDTEAKTLWDTNYARNGDLKTYPCILYDDGTVAMNVTVTWTGSPGTQSTTVNLPVLRQWLMLTSYISLFAAAWKGEVYDVEAGLDLYTYMQLKPYRLVRINEVGGLCYLNRISNFDPYSGKAAKMQVVRWVKIDKPLVLGDVAQAFVDDNLAAYDAIDVTIEHLSPTSEYIYLTAKVPGVDFTGDTTAETLADDLAGTVVTVDANVVPQERIDRIVLSGSSGRALITCNGLAKQAIWNTSLTQTATDFVSTWAAAYLAIGVIVTSISYTIFFKAAVPGTDFTGSTIITPGLPDLNGSVYNVQPNIAAVARQDYVLLSGIKGIINITCSGLTRPAGFKIG